MITSFMIYDNDSTSVQERKETAVLILINILYQLDIYMKKDQC